MGECGLGEQVVEFADERRERAVHGRLDEFPTRGTTCDVDEPRALRVACLAERHRDGAAAVAHVLFERLRAVQVPERGVVEA